MQRTMEPRRPEYNKGIGKVLKQLVREQNIQKICLHVDILHLEFRFPGLLHYALKYKKMESLQLLLDLGGNVNMKNKAGETLIEAAIKDVHCDEHVAVMLLNQGVQVNEPLDEFGVTLLARAITYGKYKVASHLVRMGANVCATDNIRRFGPLHLLNYFQMGRLCLTEPAEKVFERLVRLYEVLFEYGVDVNQLDHQNKTALTCCHGDIDPIEPTWTQRFVLKHLAKMAENREYICDNLKAEISENYGFKMYFTQCWVELRDLKALGLYNMIRWQYWPYKLKLFAIRDIGSIIFDKSFGNKFVVYGRDVKAAFKSGLDFKQKKTGVKESLDHYIPKRPDLTTEMIIQKLSAKDVVNLVKAVRKNKLSVNPWTRWFIGHVFTYLKNTQRSFLISFTYFKMLFFGNNIPKLAPREKLAICPSEEPVTEL